MSYVIVENNTIIFDKDFDLDLDEYYVVLLTVKHIKFGTFFNKMVDKLPENIETIHFGDYFNQPVDNLPESVKGITFGAMFNKTIDLIKGLKKPEGKVVTVSFGAKDIHPGHFEGSEEKKNKIMELVQ